MLFNKGAYVRELVPNFHFQLLAFAKQLIDERLRNPFGSFVFVCGSALLGLALCRTPAPLVGYLAGCAKFLRFVERVKIGVALFAGFHDFSVIC